MEELSIEEMAEIRGGVSEACIGSILAASAALATAAAGPVGWYAAALVISSYGTGLSIGFTCFGS